MVLERRQRRSASFNPTTAPNAPITQKDGLRLNGQLNLSQPLNHAEPGLEATQVKIQMLTCRFAE